MGAPPVRTSRTGMRSRVVLERAGSPQDTEPLLALQGPGCSGDGMNGQSKGTQRYQSFAGRVRLLGRSAVVGKDGPLSGAGDESPVGDLENTEVGIQDCPRKVLCFINFLKGEALRKT